MGTVDTGLCSAQSVHQVLNVLDFTSDRACMSIIVRSPDGVIRLHSKGSDAALLPRLAPGTDAALLTRTQKNLHNFSVKVSPARHWAYSACSGWITQLVHLTDRHNLTPPKGGPSHGEVVCGVCVT